MATDASLPEVVVFVVDDLLAGNRLDRVVAGEAGMSRNGAKSLIEEGGVLVDGVAVPAKTKVVSGSTVVVTMPEAAGGPEPEDVSFALVYQDEHVAVIDKPAGIVVHPGAGNPNGTLVSGLMFRGVALLGAEQRWGIVHRLDRDTSGLLVVARSLTAHGVLQTMMAEHAVRRVYAALAFGHFGQTTGTIEAPIGRNPRNPVQMAVTHGGRPSRTHYRKLADWDSVTLLQVTLETGRTHQIRVHLSAIDHPVVADPMYGKGATSIANPGRVFLHARALEFDHPVTGEACAFRAELPQDLEDALVRLGPPTSGTVRFPD